MCQLNRLHVVTLNLVMSDRCIVVVEFLITWLPTIQLSHGSLYVNIFFTLLLAGLFYFV